ncbi:hypothetical protein WCN65_15250, partial [Staphylococcus aureus]
VFADENGRFEYPLHNRKIVHNQEIEVSSSSPDLGDDEEDEEVEEDSYLLMKTEDSSIHYTIEKLFIIKKLRFRHPVLI